MGRALMINAVTATPMRVREDARVADRQGR
jgi:hypothetical protein